MQNYKRIGILGGISPQSSALFYKKIIEKHYQKSQDHYYPEIFMFSVNFGRLKDFQKEPDQTNYVNELVKGIDALKRAGADFAVIASNTPHRVFADIKKMTSIPLLSIVDSTANYALKNGYRRLLLLAACRT